MRIAEVTDKGANDISRGCGRAAFRCFDPPTTPLSLVARTASIESPCGWHGDVRLAGNVAGRDRSGVRR